MAVTARYRYPEWSGPGLRRDRCPDRCCDQRQGAAPVGWAARLLGTPLHAPEPGVDPPPVETTFPDGSVHRSDSSDIGGLARRRSSTPRPFGARPTAGRRSAAWTWPRSPRGRSESGCWAGTQQCCGQLMARPNACRGRGRCPIGDVDADDAMCDDHARQGDLPRDADTLRVIAKYNRVEIP
jgi:hypothetical protein